MNYLNNLLTLNCLGSGLPPIISSDLNFKIVGGLTKPTNPTENTIWVETSMDITDYTFSANQPTTRSDGTALSGGEVWIKTGTSPVDFNALKKNAIILVLMSCSQYTGSAFESKNLSIYQSGDWQPFTYYYFNNGTSNIGTPSVTSGSNGTISYLPSQGFMSIQGMQKNLVVYAEFPTAIDVSNISKVNFDLQIQTPGLNGLIHCLLRSAPGGGTLAQVIVSGTYPDGGYDGNRKTLTVDTSSISGLAYVCVHFEANFSSASYARLDVFNITGEV